MKTITLTPVGGEYDLDTDTALIDGLLAQGLTVKMACGGKGVCATCHVHVRQGMEGLSPKAPREARTLALLAAASADSRLACQARVRAEGVVVEIPEGLYIQSTDGVAELIGSRSIYDYLHPITGRVLIPKGKIITRSVFQDFQTAVKELQTAREEAE